MISSRTLSTALAAVPLACSPPAPPAPATSAPTASAPTASAPVLAGSSASSASLFPPPLFPPPLSSSSSPLSACPAVNTAAPPPTRAPAAALAACEKLREASMRRVQRVGVDAWTWLQGAWPGIARCEQDAAGAWLLEVSTFSRREGNLLGEFQLVRIAADGKVNATTFGDSFGQLPEGVREGAAVLASFDLDGDGRFEVLLERSGYHGGGEDAWHHRKVLKMQGRDMKEFKLPIDKNSLQGLDAIADVDGDGRVDLILESPFLAPIPCTLDGEARGPRMLLHNTSAGMVLDDEVTHQFLRAECAGQSRRRLFFPPEQQVNGIDAARRSVLSVGCARLGGLGPQEAFAQIQREAPPAEQNCSLSSPLLLGAASTQVPLTVPRLECAPRPAPPR